MGKGMLGRCTLAVVVAGALSLPVGIPAWAVETAGGEIDTAAQVEPASDSLSEDMPLAAAGESEPAHFDETTVSQDIQLASSGSKDISLNTEVSDRISNYGNNTVYYCFTVPERGYVQVDFAHQDLAEGFGYWDLYLLTANSETIASWQHNIAAVEAPSSYKKIGLAAGTYYFAVRSQGGSSTYLYSFNVDFAKSNEWETELNDSIGSATSMPLNSSICGTVSNVIATLSSKLWDEDYYAFELPNSARVSLDFCEFDPKTTANLAISVLDSSNQTLVSRHYNYSNGLTQTISCGILPAGTYYVKVSATGGSSERSYRITSHQSLAGPGEVQRVAGDDAVGTSAAIARATFPSGSGWAILARDDDFADAMSATGLAGVLKAPVVLTNRNSLSDDAKRTIQKLDVKNVYIIGGTGAMPGDFESALRNAGVSGTIERVFGNEAYDTSVKCASKIVAHGGDCQNAIVAYGQNFQDALSMSSFAYKYGAPIFLQTYGASSKERHLTDDALAMLKTGAFSRAKIYVAGGAGAVSESSVERAIASNLRGGNRLFGETGYDTSNAIARYMVDNGLLDDAVVCIANGAMAPGGTDALAGSALAGANGGVMLLANPNQKIEVVDLTTIDGVLASDSAFVRKAYVLGGTYVMPKSFCDKVSSMIA